jgi:type IX secretion system PorP/SprF family membrane protein
MALKRLIVLAITGVSALQAWAQDAHFSQFYANPIYLNPAFAGVQQCPTVHANYRNQYPGLGVYQTYSTSVDQYVDALNGGLGLLILQDESANRTLRLTEASLVYSYHLKVNRKFSVLTGFQGTFRQRALDWGNLTFPDQIDPFYGFVKPTNEIAPNQTTTSNVDLSLGMVGFTEKFYFGLSAHHITQPDEGFFRNGNLPVKVGAQAGATLRLGRKRLYNSLDNLLIPNVVYQGQGGAHQITAGVSFNRGPVSGGLAYRQALGAVSYNPDALVVLVGLAPNDVPWRFGYSYDYTISPLKNTLGGAHEVTLSYRLACRSRKARYNEIKCPKF